MKKRILLIIFLLALGIKTVKATTVYDQITSYFIGSYHYVDEFGKFGDFEAMSRKSDGTPAYCIEPGASLSDGNYEGYLNLPMDELAAKVGLTKEKLQEISLMAYYGYGYLDHTSVQWRVATQAKIWLALGRNFEWTSRNYSPNPWQYVIPIPSIIQEKYNELDSLINRHYLTPSFNNQTIEVPYGMTFTLNDTNNVLSDFQILNNDSQIAIENNALKITPKESTSEKTITFEKNMQAWNNSFVVFHHNVGQDILVSGNIEPVLATLTFKTITGKIKIEKVDKDTQKCLPSGEASLENAEYSLFKENGELVQTVILKNCTAMIENLPVGNYYLMETKAPEGYQLNPQKYSVSINEKNIKETQILQVEDEVYKTELTIDKKYLTDEGLKPEANTEFQIIKKETNEILTTVKTDDQGKIHITLPYGEYIIKQITGLENYQKVEDILFKVEKTTPDKTTLSLINKPYTSKLQIIKIDAETNEPLHLENIKFKIYDLENQKYICQTSDCIFTTDKFGQFITDELFPSTYQIEEIDQIIPGYLINPEKIIFTVDKNSPKLITIKYKNTRVKGSIEIIKKDSQNKPLENVVFTLYAKEDIYVNHKQIYKKNEKIQSFITNKEGKIEIDNLPLGKYYFLETNPLEGYIPLEDPIEVNLEFKDSKTEIVFEKREIINEIYSIPNTYQDAFILPKIYMYLERKQNEKEKNNTNSLTSSF